MGYIPDSSYITVENVTGIGVAGPPADETEVQEDVNTENTVQSENSEFSQEEVGNNIDVKA